MSPSVSHRRQPGRPRRPSRGRNRPPQRLAIFTVVIRSALVVMVVGSIAAGGYFAFRDNLLARAMTETKIASEGQIADLRVRADRIMNRLDQGQVEQQVNALLQRQATLEKQISALTDDLQSATASINLKTLAPDLGHDRHQRAACRGRRLGSVETEISQHSPPSRAPGPSPARNAAAAKWWRSSRSRCDTRARSHTDGSRQA